MSSDDFTSIDDHMFEEEPEKAGFNAVWVGVANATDQTISVETHTDSAVPDKTSSKLNRNKNTKLLSQPNHNLNLTYF
jgi:hypothetical protein